MNKKTRYAIVGLGVRSEMYCEAIVNTFQDRCLLSAICDSNAGRLQDRAAWAKSQNVTVPSYNAADFDKMMQETDPECILVMTTDRFHDDYICRALESGCDVITEKPMTIDEIRCRRILDTQKKTGKSVTVTFNYRYAPVRAQIKELLMSGAIGNILSVDFHWMLDREHGADYFRRWHRNKVNSGGLMVHKATHHFDLVNWWLSTTPQSVFATGHRKFYTPKMAERYGLESRGTRCLDCPDANRCPFAIDLKKLDTLSRLYLNNEKHDGYFRDQCVFSDEIDIEDSMVVAIDYASGAKLSYSLNAFMPWEGYTVTFNGTEGRLEHKCEEQVYVSGDGSVPGMLKEEGTWIKVYPMFSPAYEVAVKGGEGAHGGADPLMLKDVFCADDAPDKYMRKADYRAGAWSILCGIAANHSMEAGHSIRLEDLVSGIDTPDYPPMPADNTLIKTETAGVRSWLHQ